jgi:predicted nucleotidyltransferase
MSHGLSEAAVNGILSVLRNFPEVEKATLYGSRAKGTHRRGSDIDLTLHGERLNHSGLTRICDELDDLLLPYKMDVSLFKDLTHPDLIDHIRRVGLTLYERSEVPQDA